MSGRPLNTAVYEIMHKDRVTARIHRSGHCRIYSRCFMPYDLYLEEEEDVDALVNNLTNFYYWCAGRVLTLDRVYAKEILNSLGMPQAVTDRDRAKIALTYHCTCLTDVFWVREQGERAAFGDVNLYENHLDNTLKLDKHNYYMMNLVDYLVGNTDRHWGNWGAGG